MRRWLGLMWIGCAAASAAAQDRDPFDAVLEAQRVREKQMVRRVARMKREWVGPSGPAD